jgi:hypothetical protein
LLKRNEFLMEETPALRHAGFHGSLALIGLTHACAALLLGQVTKDDGFDSRNQDPESGIQIIPGLRAV